MEAKIFEMDYQEVNTKKSNEIKSILQINQLSKTN